MAFFDAADTIELPPSNAAVADDTCKKSLRVSMLHNQPITLVKQIKKWRQL
jgi:hypothetical protein